MSDSILYKLIVLYMLDVVEGPLSTDQLSGFLLQKEYTNYFKFQEMMENLRESGLITAETSYHRTLYYMTDAGKSTLKFYGDRIPDDVRKDVLAYLYENEVEIREILTVFSDYYPENDGTFKAHCQVRENNRAIIDLTMSMPTKSQAEAVCNQWKQHYSDVYEMLMDTLLR